MKRRKLVAMLMGVVLALTLLAGCGGDELSENVEKVNSNSTTSSQAADSPTESDNTNTADAATNDAAAADANTADANAAANAGTEQPIVSDSQSVETQTPEYYFKDNVLVSEDVRIEITAYQTIFPGQPGNKYGDKPVIAFWYNTTNLSGNENVTPMSAWMAMFTAIQDNDPNAVNELQAGLLPDDRFLESQLQTIKKDGTVECATSYELDDTQTPVTLKATKGILGEALGEQTYPVA